VRKILIAFLVLSSVSVVGFIGFRQYTDTQALQRAYLLIKDSSLRVNNCFSARLEGRKITYKEALDTIELSIAEIDKSVLQVQASITPRTKSKMQVIIAYLQIAQTVLRAQALCYRKELSAGAVHDRLKRKLDQYRSSESLPSRIELETHLKEAEIEEKEEAEARSELKEEIRKMLGMQSVLRQFVPADVLIDASIAEKVLAIESQTS
jgi:hypothetical protein